MVVAQVLAGAGLAAGIVVGALLAEDMLGATGAAGVPAALLTIGSAVAAGTVGRLSQRHGRRVGLAAGYGAGALGGAGVVAAAALDNVPLLFGALVLYGSGAATNLQARYAGTDLAPADRRGRAVSVVLVATTLGAVVGPNLVERTGAVAARLGIPELAGPFLLATVAYALAACAVLALLRPDPLLAARALPAPRDGGAAPVAAPGPRPGSLPAGAATMVVAQLVMIAVMTMTPVHMRDHGHSVGAAGLVVSIHIAAMYLPSPVTGWLVDRVGRRPVVVTSGVTLLAAGVIAAAAAPASMALLALALALLGLGWNLGLIAGTAMVTDAVPLERRAAVQGTVDIAVALAGATGGMTSGLVVAGAGYPALSAAGGALGLALVAILLADRRLAASARRAAGGRRAARVRRTT
jgi:MFS family permease